MTMKRNGLAAKLDRLLTPLSPEARKWAIAYLYTKYFPKVKHEQR